MSSSGGGGGGTRFLEFANSNSTGGISRQPCYEPPKVSLCASGSFSGIRKPNSPSLLKIP